jgi:hypothetical protein
MKNISFIEAEEVIEKVLGKYHPSESGIVDAWRMIGKFFY